MQLFGNVKLFLAELVVPPSHPPVINLSPSYSSTLTL